jgi:hypothetical protein
LRSRVPPQLCPSERSEEPASAVAFAFLSVIPGGNLLVPARPPPIRPSYTPFAPELHPVSAPFMTFSVS